jgi:non-ribosomal peptide synthetase component F
MNTQAYVLDARQRPVPIGVAGELYIGGAALAQGYLGRPELTAEKFIPNLFANEPGQLLYKTGDLVRFQSDGNNSSAAWTISSRYAASASSPVKSRRS